MNSLSLNTRNASKRLQAKGFNAAQADEIVDVVTDIANDAYANLVKKPDLERTDAGLRTEITRVETALRAEITGVETALRAEMARVETTLRAEIIGVETRLRAEIVRLEFAITQSQNKMLLWLFAMMVSMTGILIAFLRH
jgi:hypothetical protein